MRLKIADLRRIIREEVARVRRGRMHEAHYEPSFDMSLEGTDEAIAAAEDALIKISDEDNVVGSASVYANLWDAIRDEMTSSGRAQLDLDYIGHAAGMSTDGFEWKTAAKEIADAIYAVPFADRGSLRDGREILGFTGGSVATKKPAVDGPRGKYFQSNLGGKMHDIEPKDGKGFPGYFPNKLGW